MAGSLNLSGGRKKIVGEVLELAREASPMAIATLKRIAGDTEAPHAAQVTAAIALLDRAWAKPAQSLALAVNRPLEELTDAELLAIAAGSDDESVPPATEH